MDIICSLHDLFSVHLEFTSNNKQEIKSNLNNWFSEFAPNFMYDYRYKKRIWDGKIRYFNNKLNTLPIGLLSELKEFCKTFSYSIEININVENNILSNYNHEDVKELINNMISKMEIPTKYTPYDFQKSYFAKFISKNRILIESPTASGKSLIIYLAIRYVLPLLENNEKILLIVPTIQLVEQMYKDFEDYGFNSEKYCARIWAESKDQKVKLATDKRIVISTWQSLYKLPKSEFDNITFFIGDEVHKFGAVNVKGLLLKCSNAIYRMGLTGTLPSDKCSLWTIQGLFDKSTKYITTMELVERGNISKFKINVMNLQYTEEQCKIVSKLTYNEEIDYIYFQENRFRFIIELVKKIINKNENVLLLFNSIAYGKNLVELLKKENIESYYVDGSVNMKDRELVRYMMESNNSQVGICSFKTFGTGINIKNLHNIVFLNTSKAEINILQAIGRGLRLHESKDIAIIYDIVDNLKYRKKLNYCLNHFMVRKELYEKNDFIIKYFDIDVNKY